MHCIDHFAELGDICFGDLHTGKYLDDKVGISSVVTRTKEMDNILNDMANEKVITLETVTEEDLLNSQKYVKIKKHSNPVYMRIDHLLGWEVPKYDVTFHCVPMHQAIKSYLVKTSQMFIGKHKCFHWMIKLMSKDMKNWR